MGRGAETDLFGLYPVDGYANSRRGNVALGRVAAAAAAKYVTANGARVGPCVAAGGEGGKGGGGGRRRGVVKTFSRKKGYGFVRCSSLSLSPSLSLSLSLSTYLSISLSFYLIISAYLPICLFQATCCLPSFLSACLPASFCLSACLKALY